ncbi:MerR family transcriptional regulator [Streptomyces sannanensis]|uniref:MerR family transcriptional regulator n=1 Tax=Streptomyces sannanensis TaxID=285536 RepID=A0ABP6S6K5_9ACTN
MRIGELSRRTGVSVPTIKYYVREGLLQAGQLTSPNQASYSELHERRLRLIRALIDVGGLSVAAVAEVLAAVDDPARPVHRVLGTASTRIAVERGDDGEGEKEAARGEVEAFLARRGWCVDRSHPAVESLVGAVTALARVGHGSLFAEVLDDYADAVEGIARADLDYVGRRVAVEDLVESVVIGTVLGDAVLAAMRRLAHVDASVRRFPPA